MINYKHVLLASLTAGTVIFGAWDSYNRSKENTDKLRLQLRLEQAKTKQMELQIHAERNGIERVKTETGKLQSDRKIYAEQRQHQAQLEEERRKQQQLQAEKDEAERELRFVEWLSHRSIY